MNGKSRRPLASPPGRTQPWPAWPDNTEANWTHRVAPRLRDVYLSSVEGLPNTRSQEFEVFTHDEEMKKIIEEQQIKLIGYKPLRDLQRKERQQAK